MVPTFLRFHQRYFKLISINDIVQDEKGVEKKTLQALKSSAMIASNIFKSYY